MIISQIGNQKRWYYFRKCRWSSSTPYTFKKKSLKNYKRGYSPSSSKIANTVITVFSVWDNLPSNEEKIATFIHEIGHNIRSRLKQDESNRWLDFSGWPEKEGELVPTIKDQLVSIYGATKPPEDFAETFTVFRYNLELLKKNEAYKVWLYEEICLFRPRKRL